MEKKTYKTPTLRVINISTREILDCSVIGNINTGSNLSYDNIGGYDEGGWGYGSPD